MSARKMKETMRTPAVLATSKRDESGVALIIALGVLAILAILGTSFLMATRLEYRIANNYMGDAKAELIARSGFEHAMAVLRFDKLGTDERIGNEMGKDDIPFYNYEVMDDPIDSFLDPWRIQFYDREYDDPPGTDQYEDPETGAASGKPDDVDFYGLTEDVQTSDAVWNALSVDHTLDEGTWIPVHGQDEFGIVRGRYAVLVEDELSKINLNVCSSSSAAYEVVDPLLLTTPYAIRLDDLLTELGICTGDEQAIADTVVKYRWGDASGSPEPGYDTDNDDADGVADEFDEAAAFSYLQPFGQPGQTETDNVFKTIDQLKMLKDIHPDLAADADWKYLEPFITCYSESQSLSQDMGREPAAFDLPEDEQPARQEPRVYLNGALFPHELFDLFVEAGLDDPAAFTMNLMAFIDADRCAPLEFDMNKAESEIMRPVWGFRPPISPPETWDYSDYSDWRDTAEYDKLPSWAKIDLTGWGGGGLGGALIGSMIERAWASLYFEQDLSTDKRSRYYGIEGPRIAEVMPYGRLRLDLEHRDLPDDAGITAAGWFVNYVNACPGAGGSNTFNKACWCRDDVVGGATKPITLEWKDLPEGVYEVTVHPIAVGAGESQGFLDVSVDTSLGSWPLGVTLSNAAVTFPASIQVGDSGAGNWLRLNLSINGPTGPVSGPGDVCIVDYIELKSPSEYVEIVNVGAEADISDWYVSFGDAYSAPRAAIQVPGSMTLNYADRIIATTSASFTDSFDGGGNEFVAGVPSATDPAPDDRIALKQGSATGVFHVTNFDDHYQLEPFDIRLYDNYGRMVDRMTPPTVVVAGKQQVNVDGMNFTAIVVVPTVFPFGDSVASIADLEAFEEAHSLLWLAMEGSASGNRRPWQVATMYAYVEGNVYRVWQIEDSGFSGFPAFLLAWPTGEPLDSTAFDDIMTIDECNDVGDSPTIVQFFFERQAMERVDPGLDFCPHNVQPVLFTNSDGPSVGWGDDLSSEYGGRPNEDHPLAADTNDEGNFPRSASEYPDPSAMTYLPNQPLIHLGQLKDVPLGYVDDGTDAGSYDPRIWFDADAARERTAGGLLAGLGSGSPPPTSPWLARVMDCFTCLGYRIDVAAAVANEQDATTNEWVTRCIQTPLGGVGGTDIEIPQAPYGALDSFRFEGLRVPPGNYVVQLHVVPSGDDATYNMKYDILNMANMGPEICGLSLGVVGSLDKNHPKWGRQDATESYLYYHPDPDEIQNNLVSRFFAWDGTTARAGRYSENGFGSAGNYTTYPKNDWVSKEPVFFVDEAGTLDLYLECEESDKELAEVILSPLWIPGKVNLNTASQEVLTAALCSACDTAYGGTANDARDLAIEIVDRRQLDARETTGDGEADPFGRRYCRNGDAWEDEAVKSPASQNPSIGVGELLDVVYLRGSAWGLNLDQIYDLFGYSVERFTVQSDVFRITVIGQAWRDVEVDQSINIQPFDPLKDRLLGEKRITSVIRR